MAGSSCSLISYVMILVLSEIIEYSILITDALSGIPTPQAICCRSLLPIMVQNSQGRETGNCFKEIWRKQYTNSSKKHHLDKTSYFVAMESQEEDGASKNHWLLYPSPSHQETPVAQAKKRSPKSYVSSPPKYTLALPCATTPREKQTCPSTSSRKSTPTVLSPVSVSSLTALIHRGTTPSNSTSRSSSFSANSTGTVEIHEETHAIWGLQDTESESEVSGGDTPAAPRQRLVRVHWPGSRCGSTTLDEDGTQAIGVSPLTAPTEADVTTLTRPIDTMERTEGTKCRLTTSSERTPTSTGVDSSTVQICDSSPRHPSLTVTAPDTDPFYLEKTLKRPRILSAPLGVGERQVSATSTSTFKSRSPRDSPKLWLRRDISSGRYFVTRAPDPPAFPVQSFTAFDISSSICAVPAMCKGEIAIQYTICLSFVLGEDAETSRTASLKIAVKDANLSDQTIRLELGDDAVMLNSERKASVEDPERPAIITIFRHRIDADASLNVCLTVSYPILEGRAIARLPTFRALAGRTISESIFVKEPSLPLVVKSSIRDVCSTWSYKSQEGQGIAFDRIKELPKLFPEVFSDVPVVRFRVLQPVNFLGLERRETSSATIWNMDIFISRVLGGDTDCSMRLDVAVGAAQTLLNIEAHAWRPVYCLINGRPITSDSGYWVKTEDHRCILIKQPYMKHGQAIEVEVHWQTSWMDVKNAITDTEGIPIPRIIDNGVLGGRLTCTIPASMSSPRKLA